MAKEVLEKIEEVEKMLKEEFEKIQKNTLLEIEAFKEKLENNLHFSLEDLNKKYILDLEKEKEKLIETLKPKVDEAKLKSEELKTILNSKKEKIIKELKDIIMKG